MKSNLLQLKNIKIVEKINDWKEAIKKSVQPLIEGKYVNPSYVDGIIENTEKFGAYYIVTDNVALIHARPEQGVIKRQLAVTVVESPVLFPNDDKAQILVVLAAKDKEDHLKVMRELTELFMDHNKVISIINSKDTQEIYNIFSQYL